MTDPENNDVVAAAESVRRWVDVATWTAIALGLAFTAVNVQTFAAAGAAAWSPGWVVAWLLDPMVSVLLLAVVRAEQVTARWQVPMPWQVPAVKWSAFAATYAMNTWSAWRDAVPSSVVLHSVPPLFVLLAAEVAPALRERLTEAVRVATTTTSTPESVQRVVVPAVDDIPAAQAVPEPVEPIAPPPSSDDTTAVPDDRVRDLAELLAAGCDVTGPQAAALHGVSDRTGRRLVTAARTYLEQHPTRPGLHLVEPRTAGGTA